MDRGFRRVLLGAGAGRGAHRGFAGTSPRAVQDLLRWADRDFERLHGAEGHSGSFLGRLTRGHAFDNPDSAWSSRWQPSVFQFFLLVSRRIPPQFCPVDRTHRDTDNRRNAESEEIDDHDRERAPFFGVQRGVKTKSKTSLVLNISILY